MMVQAAAPSQRAVMSFTSQTHRTLDPRAHQDFYTSILGFEDETHLRPDLPFKGAFVRAGAQQVGRVLSPPPSRAALARCSRIKQLHPWRALL
jgi:hypothetical protein